MDDTTAWADDFFSGLWIDAQCAMWSDDDSEHDAESCATFLDLPPGSRVLDVPCGNGRIAARLALNGYQVTGLDRSAELLTRANELARTADATLTLDEGDMRELPYSNQFDGAICMWGSLGYGDEGDDRAFFAGVARALEPGGVFLIDTHVTETLLPQFTDASWHQAGDIAVAERREYDYRDGRVHSEWLLSRGDQVQRRRSSIRIYGFSELCKLLQSCGFDDFDPRGSTHLEPFELGSPRLFLRAVRSG